jgi:hypothetical protein
VYATCLQGVGFRTPADKKKDFFYARIQKKKALIFPFEKYNILVSLNFIRKIQAFGYP